MCADTDEGKGEKKKNLLTGVSGGRGVRICCMRMCCVWMPMSAKKREEEKKLTWNGGMQTQMCCVQMALHVDANECKKKREEKKNLLGMGACRRKCVACRWRCMWMPMSAKKKEKKKKTYLDMQT